MMTVVVAAVIVATTIVSMIPIVMAASMTPRTATVINNRRRAVVGIGLVDNRGSIRAVAERIDGDVDMHPSARERRDREQRNRESE